MVLLLVDTQRGCFNESLYAFETVKKNIKKLIAEARANNIEVIYEPQDWVIIKQNGMKAQVINVVNDGDGNLKMLTIVASNGVCYDADPDEIEPDPMYLVNLKIIKLRFQETNAAELTSCRI